MKNLFKSSFVNRFTYKNYFNLLKILYLYHMSYFSIQISYFLEKFKENMIQFQPDVSPNYISAHYTGTHQQ